MQLSNDEIVKNDNQKKHFLDEDIYLLLCEAQRRIREATEVTVPLRKIVNKLITVEIIESTVDFFIEKYK